MYCTCKNTKCRKSKTIISTLKYRPKVFFTKLAPAEGSCFHKMKNTVSNTSLKKINSLVILSLFRNFWTWPLQCTVHYCRSASGSIEQDVDITNTPLKRVWAFVTVIVGTTGHQRPARPDYCSSVLLLLSLLSHKSHTKIVSSFAVRLQLDCCRPCWFSTCVSVGAQ